MSASEATGGAGGASGASPLASAAASRSKRKAPKNLFYQQMHERNIHNVKLLVSTVLPVTYQDSVFKKFLTFPEEFCQLAFYDDIFVGCVACRVEGEGSSKKLYMMILAVLAPYRSRGIGSAMMDKILAAVEDGKAGHGDIKEVYLHVHTVNEEAQRFYESFGFTKAAEPVRGYYAGIDPPDAFLYRRAVNGARLEDLPLPVHKPTA